jgi:hypothetical protein
VVRDGSPYELRSDETRGSAVIEVYAAPNGFGACTGRLPPLSFLHSRYMTPDPTSSWHCAPYDRLEAPESGAASRFKNRSRELTDCTAWRSSPVVRVIDGVALDHRRRYRCLIEAE